MYEEQQAVFKIYMYSIMHSDWLKNVFDTLALTLLQFFSARCNIYISRLCYDVSVHPSVTEVHWHIIADLRFQFRSKFTVHCGRGEG